MTALAVHDEALGLLQVAVAALNLIPDQPDCEELLGAPDEQYVAAGLPVDDCCEQIVVHVDPIGELPSARSPKAAWIPQVTFHVMLGRCVPVPDDDGNPPSAEAKTAAAKQLNVDGWVLWNSLRNAVRDGLIFAGCKSGAVTFDPALARTPSGGCGGWVLVVRAPIDGFYAELELES